jgi:hypothetical protein
MRRLGGFSAACLGLLHGVARCAQLVPAIAVPSVIDAHIAVGGDDGTTRTQNHSEAWPRSSMIAIKSPAWPSRGNRGGVCGLALRDATGLS